ncbi:putative peroxiredoxin [Enhygromyxa salina]|uniref:Peroxiredoxin n=1 Tax=Enhygromyxa salina TaxID=215803 RepID=A0A2S9YAL1_9BACT|nr:peroxiredoxin [Enhygromyxa salina]PRQ02150.1 putative peroxiredoxin [Enhygromyxa salina]
MDTSDLQRAIENFLNRLRSVGKTEPKGVPPTFLQINGPAPDFEAKTTHGDIRLSSWNKDKWVILFSHPADFTPVCTTEFVGFAKRWKEFQERDVALIGNSIDSVYAHIAWARNIEDKLGTKIPFPIIADLDMKVAKAYGMLHVASSDTSAIRALFVIDPKRTLRAMIYYPLSVGRNIDEILRVVDALQMTDETGLAAPANWKPGEAAIMPPPQTMDEAEARMKEREAQVEDWYYAKKKSA